MWFLRTGDRGADGPRGGTKYTFSNDTDVHEDPGDGKVRFNNTDASEISVISFHDEDDNGVDLQDFMRTWDDTRIGEFGTYGDLVFQSEDRADDSYAVFRIKTSVSGAVVEEDGWFKVSVQNVSASADDNPFANDEKVVYQFIRSGDAGATWISGLGTPNPLTQGTTGDFFLRTDTEQWYEKTNATTWTPRGSFTGSRGGTPYKYSTSTTDSDPGEGKVRFNDQTFDDITEIYIDDLDDSGDTTPPTSGADHSSFMDTWDDSSSTVKGHLIFQSREDADGSYAVFAVTSINGNGTSTYYTIGVSALSTSEEDSHEDNFVFDNDEEVVYQFIRAGDRGDTGADGADGAAGDDGKRGGTLYTFSNSTDVSEDPGTGKIRFNNATAANVGTIAIDDLDANSVSQVGQYAAWVESTSTVKGHIVIQSADAADASYQIFEVTARVDQTGYSTFTVDSVVNSGDPSFSNDEEVVLQFTRTGDKGDTGSGGVVNFDDLDDVPSYAEAHAGKFLKVKATAEYDEIEFVALDGSTLSSGRYDS